MCSSDLISQGVMTHVHVEAVRNIRNVALVVIYRVYGRTKKMPKEKLERICCPRIYLQLVIKVYLPVSL